MNVDRAVLAFAGAVTLVSAVLACLVSPAWLLLTAFVGFNMLQAAITASARRHHPQESRPETRLGLQLTVSANNEENKHAKQLA